MQMTFKQLRRETRAVALAVERGETVVLTYRGKPVAEMTPVRKRQRVCNNNNELFGVWADHKAVASVPDYMTMVRKGRFK